jgi:hypothetical protein
MGGTSGPPGRGEIREESMKLERRSKGSKEKVSNGNTREGNKGKGRGKRAGKGTKEKGGRGGANSFEEIRTCYVFRNRHDTKRH